MKRRDMLKLTGGLALGALYHERSVASESLQPLEPSNPQAQALAFVQDAADADPDRYQSGSRCDNCLHYQAGKSDQSGQGGCAIFPIFSVPAKGWCAGWAKQVS